MTDEAPSVKKALLAFAKKHYIVSSVLVIGLLLGTLIVVSAYAPVLNQYEDQKESASNIRDKVTDADYAVRNYEWFIEQREKISAMERKIQNVRESMKLIKETYGNDSSEWSRQTRTQYNRELTELQGYKDQHENLVAQYNKNMNSSVRNLYNNSLPLEMEEKFWTGDLVP